MTPSLFFFLFATVKAADECTADTTTPSVGTVIDLSQFLSGNATIQKKIADTFDMEMQQKGFIILSNHGVADGIINSLYSATDEFFMSPPESKNLYQLGAFGNAGYQPYGTQSTGDTGVPDLVESYDIRNIAYNWFLTKPKWEDLPSAFTKDNALQNYVEKLGILRSRLHDLATMALGLESNLFEMKMISQPNESSFGSVRINFYFELDPSASYNNATRLGPHTDYLGFNLLSADDICGLQFYINDEWIDFQCERNLFIVIGGDYTEHWTNHRWIAAKHRVVRCVDYGTRISVSYYTGPNWEELLLPFPGCKKCAVDSAQHCKRKFESSQTYKF